MRHRWFKILTSLSLVLCLATVSLWARSYWYWDRIVFNTGSGKAITLDARSGKCVLEWSNWWGTAHVGTELTFELSQPIPPVESIPGLADAPQFLGFCLGSGSLRNRVQNITYWLIGVPFWAMLVAWLGMGVLCLRRMRRPTPGVCPICGYDLRATPDKCPECGTEVKRSIALAR